MQDAMHLRSQAGLCLEIARQVSDPQTAENLRATAAQYLARAEDLEAEKHSDAGDAPLSAPQ